MIDVLAKAGAEAVKFGLGFLLKEEVPARAINSLCERVAVVSEPDRATLKGVLVEWCRTEGFIAFLAELAKHGKMPPEADMINSLSEFAGTSDIVLGLPATIVAPMFLRELSLRLSLLDQEYDKRVQYESHAEVCQRLNGIENQLFQKPHSQPDLAQEEECRKSDEQEIHESIDTAVRHLNRGRAMEAQDLLRNARHRLSDLTSPSQYLKSRIAGNLGCAYVLVEDFLNAKLEYERAHEIRPSRLTLSNLAYGYLLCNQNELALKFSSKAVDFAEPTGRILAIHLRALYANAKVAELAKLTAGDSLCKCNADCLMSRGFICLEQLDYSSAEDLFHQAKAASPYDPQLYFLEGYAIAQPICKSALSYVPLDGYVDKKAESRLAIVDALMTESLDLMKEQDHFLNRSRALLNRAAARLLMGKIDGSESDCNEVLEHESSNQQALSKLGVIMMLKGKHEIAIEKLEQLQEPFKTLLGMTLATSYVNLDRLQDAKTAIRKFESDKAIFLESEKMLYTGKPAFLILWS